MPGVYDPAMSTSSLTRNPLPDSAINMANCLVDLACDAGTGIDCDAVLTALGAGIGFFFTQSADDDLPGFAECHDFALMETAALFGVRIRAMHPPRARHRLSESEEFAEHFTDSYVPLIERALDNNQRVLAFRGWSSEAGATWGIVDRHDNDSDALWGRIPDCAEPIRLDQPALQCYVVEELQSVKPNAKDILTRGAMTAVELRERGSQVYPELLQTLVVFEELIRKVEVDTNTVSIDEIVTLFKRMEQRRRLTVRFLAKNVAELEAIKRMPNLLFLTENDAVACRRFLKNANHATLKKTLVERLEINREIEGLLASFV